MLPLLDSVAGNSICLSIAVLFRFSKLLRALEFITTFDRFLDCPWNLSNCGLNIEFLCCLAFSNPFNKSACSCWPILVLRIALSDLTLFYSWLRALYRNEPMFFCERAGACRPSVLSLLSCSLGLGWLLKTFIILIGTWARSCPDLSWFCDTSWMSVSVAFASCFLLRRSRLLLDWLSGCPSWRPDANCSSPGWLSYSCCLLPSYGPCSSYPSFILFPSFYMCAY